MHIEHSFRRAKRRHNQLIGRILGDLINRRSPLSDESLENLKVAADKVIFDGKLGDRVKWRWSFGHESQYGKDLLGTTALRFASCGRGFETLIVLSTPLLLNSEFNRDLLLSTFFHELIHCYLFIQCGLGHAKDDGHTAGFRKIAGIIDEWIVQANGHQRLHLCNMRANLDQFRRQRRPQCGARSRYARYERCRSGSKSPEYIPFPENKMCHDR
jgi:SprT-like family